MRYVAYVRISSEEQRGNYSMAAQEHAIEASLMRRQAEQAGRPPGCTRMSASLAPRMSALLSNIC